MKLEQFAADDGRRWVYVNPENVSSVVDAVDGGSRITMQNGLTLNVDAKPTQVAESLGS